MANDSDQFIAFEINGGENVEISNNKIGGKINRAFKSNLKIENLKISGNTILNTNEIEVLKTLIATVETDSELPVSIKEEIIQAINNLEHIKNQEEKNDIIRNIKQFSEKIIHLGSSTVTIYPVIMSLLSKL